MTESSFHPLDPDVTRDPYPHYAALRRDSPIHPIEGLGLWAVSRHADVVEVLRNPQLFSSSPMRAALARPETFAPEERQEEPWPEPQTLIGSDPPVHTRMRKIVNRGFTVARVNALEPRIREIARELVDRFIAKGECDWVSEFAVPLPVSIIAELLGIDRDRSMDFKRWSDAMVRMAFDPIPEDELPEVQECLTQWAAHFDPIIEARRLEPGDDIISALLRHEEEGALEPAEMKSLIGTLLVAGNVTTTNLIANAMLALLQNPQELAKLQGHPELVPGLVEEALRYDSPIQLLPRMTTADTELAGRPIPKETPIALLFGSANRDDAAFPDANRFDVTRDANGHVSFGAGVHLCLGAPLARLEARVAFEEMLARSRDWQLTDESVLRKSSLVLRGPTRLAIAFERSDR